MATTVISENVKTALEKFLGENPNAELVHTYLVYVQNQFKLKPVLFPKEKVIYQSAEDALTRLEKAGNLWHEAEIKITFGERNVDENTAKIYICPFTGKVFGDNTHPNPQDAIYDWVSKCPENTERVGGLRVKRFFISEDPEVIASYRDKEVTKEPVKKKVFSSVMSGKLFNSAHAVKQDVRENYLRPMSLYEVQNQNRFQIEGTFLEFLQKQLVEDKITQFVEALSEYSQFAPHIQRWLS